MCISFVNCSLVSGLNKIVIFKLSVLGTAIDNSGTRSSIDGNETEFKICSPVLLILSMSEKVEFEIRRKKPKLIDLIDRFIQN
jgi:hypothetical protein